MTTLLLATRNRHKVGEIQAILGAGFRCLSLDDLGQPPTVVEDAPTFEGNARKKSETLAAWLADPAHLPEVLSAADPLLVLADDSGLEVDALAGAPGVHSARFAALDTAAAGNFTDAANNAKLLRLLDAVPRERRTARFRCVLALTPVGGGGTQCFAGACEGEIGFAARGADGFGYDPLFTPAGYSQTFAELGVDTKNQLSHRARALMALRDYLAGRG